MKTSGALRSPLSIASEASDFYAELTSRNQHFVSSADQARLKNLKVFIAGCGAAGGACIEPLARLGVTRFRLADNGAYELTNLNRQHTFVDHIGENKAAFHAAELKRINPYADVIAFPEGINARNLDALIEWADLIVDAVDVTTPDAIAMKLLLHERACATGRPVLTPLDPGFCQMGLGFDYRITGSRPLHGKLDRCRRHRHPIKALLEIFPLATMPPHTLPLIRDLLVQPGLSASQLGCAADVLSGLISAAALRFVSEDKLIAWWNVDLGSYALSPLKRLQLWLRGFALRIQIRQILRRTA